MSEIKVIYRDERVQRFHADDVLMMSSMNSVMIVEKERDGKKLIKRRTIIPLEQVHQIIHEKELTEKVKS